MNISRALETNIDAIMALVRDAVREKRKNGDDQWDDAYPGRQLITQDILSGNLFKLVDGHELLGIIVLNEEQPAPYLALAWDDGDRPLVVHRLCIDPRYQRRGLARQLMLFAEEHAAASSYSSIRLDTYSKNRAARALFESLDYQPVGDVSLREDKIFHCYKKPVGGSGNCES